MFRQLYRPYSVSFCHLEAMKPCRMLVSTERKSQKSNITIVVVKDSLQNIISISEKGFSHKHWKVSFWQLKCFKNLGRWAISWWVFCGSLLANDAFNTSRSPAGVSSSSSSFSKIIRNFGSAVIVSISISPNTKHKPKPKCKPKLKPQVQD